MLALAAAIGASVLSETLFSATNDALVSLTRAAFALGLTAWALLLLGHLRLEKLSFEPTPASPDMTIDPKDRSLHARLVAAMEVDHVYRKPGLTIGQLAATLGAPEHRLRALINQGLGHRNFATFLNDYRLAAAKAALADPEQARTPILTIAMDVGFNSLGPFNRAFKEREGVTPSEYRRHALAQTK